MEPDGHGDVMEPGSNGRLACTKHHGAGNDFLVVIDLEDRVHLDVNQVRAVCDRRFGVGADGLIRVLDGRDGAALSMELTNADGSGAEMSGNGMRCLAQAAVEAGIVRPLEFSVWTPVGVRRVDYRPAGRSGSGQAWVDMGVPLLGPDEDPPAAGRRSRRVDMGNPHLVVLVSEPKGDEVDETGRWLYELNGRQRNIEMISVLEGGTAIGLRVWERGVGETEACGTGSTAAAAAAHSWGLVGRSVDVHNPGGTLGVELSDDGARLGGPVRKVAAVVIDLGEIVEAARP